METVMKQRDLVPCQIKNAGQEEAYVVTWVSVGHGRWMEPLYEKTSVLVKPGETIDAMIERKKE